MSKASEESKGDQLFKLSKEKEKFKVQGLKNYPYMVEIVEGATDRGVEVLFQQIVKSPQDVKIHLDLQELHLFVEPTVLDNTRVPYISLKSLDKSVWVERSLFIGSRYRIIVPKNKYTVTLMDGDDKVVTSPEFTVNKATKLKIEKSKAGKVEVSKAEELEIPKE